MNRFTKTTKRRVRAAGKAGGEKAAANMTAAQRKQRALKAVQAREAKRRTC